MMDAMYKAVFMDKPWDFTYDGFKLVVNVRKREAEHVVKCSYQLTGRNYKEAFSSIFRFFNELIWFYGVRVCNVSGGHSQGSHVSLNYEINGDSYLLSFKQRVYEVPQHLALAFFREAECNESPYYRFLCFSKILEIPFAKNKSAEKIAWIDDHLKLLKGSLPSNFRDRKIASLGSRSLGDWLHEDGRHAIAHGRRNPGDLIRDPNNYDDWDDIKWANTIMQELAEMLIVRKLGVAERHTISP